MREELLELLYCPWCASVDLALLVHARDQIEIREGEIVCQACQRRMLIQKGIVQALFDSAPQIVSEAAGWVTLLDVPANQHEFQDAWILALPFVRPDQTPQIDAVHAWHRIGRNFFENLNRLDWKGKRVLEIGAGRCWGLAELARRGAYVVGIDILAHKYLGLETADVWLAQAGLYFERVLGDMHSLPFRPNSFDVVVTSAALHHTNRLELVLRETARILTPSGYALFMNEPEAPDGQPKPDLSHSPEVLHGINESCPSYREWVTAFKSVGFYVNDIWFKNGMHVLLQKDAASEFRLQKGYSALKVWVKTTIQYPPPTLRAAWRQVKRFRQTQS